MSELPTREQVADAIRGAISPNEWQAKFWGAADAVLALFNETPQREGHTLVPNDVLAAMGSHDATGADHLNEAMEACRQRDDAEAALYNIRALVDSMVAAALDRRPPQPDDIDRIKARLAGVEVDDPPQVASTDRWPGTGLAPCPGCVDPRCPDCGEGPALPGDEHYERPAPVVDQPQRPAKIRLTHSVDGWEAGSVVTPWDWSPGGLPFIHNAAGDRVYASLPSAMWEPAEPQRPEWVRLTRGLGGWDADERVHAVVSWTTDFEPRPVIASKYAGRSILQVGEWEPWEPATAPPLADQLGASVVREYENHEQAIAAELSNRAGDRIATAPPPEPAATTWSEGQRVESVVGGRTGTIATVRPSGVPEVVWDDFIPAGPQVTLSIHIKPAAALDDRSHTPPTPSRDEIAETLREYDDAHQGAVDVYLESAEAVLALFNRPAAPSQWTPHTAESIVLTQEWGGMAAGRVGSAHAIDGDEVRAFWPVGAKGGGTIMNVPLSVVAPAPAAPSLSDEDIARLFHEHYERLAPSFGYETRPDSAVPFDEVPEPNRSLMIAVAAAVRTALTQGGQP